MKKLAMGLLFSTVSVSAFADTPTFKTLTTEQDTFELCQDMATALNSNDMNPKHMTAIMEPYWSWSHLQPEKSSAVVENQVIELAHKGVPIWGSPIDVIPYNTTKFGKDNYVRHEFMLRRENLGLWYQCTFYKSKNDWKLLSFTFNDNVHNFLD